MKTARYSEEKRVIVVKFTYNPQLVKLMKTLSKRMWFPLQKYWTVLPSKSNIEILFKHDFALCPILLNRIVKPEPTLNTKTTSIEIIPNNVSQQIENRKYIKPIKGLKGTLRPFQEEGVGFIERRGGRAFIGDEMGCLSGDSVITINRGGKGKQFTLEQAYNKHNQLYNSDNHNWNMNIPSYTRSISLDNKEFRLNLILDIIYQGRKRTYTIKTKNHTIRATKDHIFYTTKGELPLANIKVGNAVFMNGVEHCPICGTTINLITYKRAKFRGHCKPCMYKLMRNNNQFKSTTYTDKHGTIMCSANLTHHPHVRTDGIPQHRLIYEAYLNGLSYNQWLYIIKYNQFKEDHRFLTSKEHIHHIDSSTTNNNISNLQLVTASQHQKLHGKYQNFKKLFIPHTEKIVSIEYYGIEKVYDIKMKSPNHNFISNNFVVHNCGKTIQAISYLQAHPELRPAVVICPANVKLNWEKEFKKWTSSSKVEVLFGRKSYLSPKNNDKGIYIINYDIIGGLKSFDSWLRFFMLSKTKCAIFDECHYLKNEKTKRYKNIKNMVEPIKCIIGLSGTPLTSRPIEMFSMLNFIDPKQFPSRFAYAKRYCGLKKGAFGWDMNGATNTAELYEQLTNPITGIMLRRKKKDVLTELPSKIRTIIPMEIDNRDEYNLAEADMIAYIRQNHGNRAAAKAKMAQALVEFEKLKQLAVKGKMKQAIDWIQDFINTGEKLAIFTSHIFVLDQLYEHFNKVSVKYGGSVQQKKEVVDKFVTNDKIRLFIGNRKAAGTGIDGLQLVCSNSCFLELGWTPGEHDQTEDRLHRMLQTKSVTAYYLIAVNTVEAKLMKMIDNKRVVINKVLDGKDTEDHALLTELLEDYLAA